MTQIPARKTVALLDSVAYMNDRFGVAFNGMITMNFQQLGLHTQEQASQALTRLNDAVAGELRRFGREWKIPTVHYFLYAHERTRDLGWHVHEAVVLPRAMHLGFEARLKKWAASRYPASVPEALDFLPFWQNASIDSRARKQAEVVRYVLKTTAPGIFNDREGRPAALHDLLNWRERKSAPLRVPRIAGTSQNIAVGQRLKGGHDYPPIEDLLTDRGLRAYDDRMRRAELFDQLRRIDA